MFNIYFKICCFFLRKWTVLLNKCYLLIPTSVRNYFLAVGAGVENGAGGGGIERMYPVFQTETLVTLQTVEEVLT